MPNVRESVVCNFFAHFFILKIRLQKMEVVKNIKLSVMQNVYSHCHSDCTADPYIFYSLLSETYQDIIDE